MSDIDFINATRFVGVEPDRPMSKRPIDIKRESAFSMEVGTDAEGGIKDMLPIGDRLYLIKENAIYAIDMADQIDPGRTNPNIPHVAQKIYPVGDKSELVGRVLMQAKYLFGREGMMAQGRDRDALMTEALNFFDEIYQLAKILEDFREEQAKAVQEYNSAKKIGGSIHIPAIMGMEGRAKSFIQKAEHSTQCMFRMCQHYTELKTGKTGWFDGFVKAVTERGDLDAEILERVGQVAQFAKFIRNCRHCVEHQKPQQKIVVSDFRLNQEGLIDLPLIEIIHGETPEPKITFEHFIVQVIESLLRAYVQICGILAYLFRSEGWKDSIGVAGVPPERRRHPFVEMYYVMNMGGVLQPIG